MQVYKLGKLCKVGSSKRIHLSDYVSEGVPFYRSKEVIELANKKNISETLFISQEKFNEIKQKFPVPCKNDILITSVGTIGIPYLVENENFYFKDGNLTWLRDFDENLVDINFIFYFLKSNSFKKQVLNNNIGAVQKALTIDYLRTVNVNLPIKTVQKKIASVLSDLDKKIELNNQINATLEQMAKTLYDYWFVQFDFPDDNGKPYKSSGGEMVYNETLKRDIPKGWEVITLGKITICHDSKRVPLSSQQRLEKQGEYPYYGATGIFDFIDDYIFDGDYVLMAEDGSVMDDKGNPILQRIYGKTWVNNHAHVLEPISDYTCYLLMLLLKDVSVKKIKTGSIQMKINQENMNNIPLVSIPEDLKNKINNILLDLDKQLISIKKQNIELIKLRDWLLPMLMNGQVTVK